MAQKVSEFFTLFPSHFSDLWQGIEIKRFNLVGMDLAWNPA
jgi:hypothetical protein